MLFFKAKVVSSTPLSEFVRSSSAEKKKVYSTVLKKASDSQNQVIARVARRHKR
jgi:hypothetical protein